MHFLFCLGEGCPLPRFEHRRASVHEKHTVCAQQNMLKMCSSSISTLIKDFARLSNIAQQCQVIPAATTSIADMDISADLETA